MVRARDPDVPPRPLPRACAAAAGVDAIARLGEAADDRHRRVRRLCPRAWSSDAGTSSRTAQSRQTTATPTCGPTRSNPARRRASTARRSPATPRAQEALGVPPAHAARDGPDVVRGRARDDAASRCPAQPPPPDVRAVRGRHRARYPDPDRIHRCAATAARALRHAPRAFTWSCSRSTRRSWSRELAPLAGFYPSVYVGVPWWFLDAPDAIRRFRAAVTETAGFSRTSGFVDDTRAFCSIPARHDMSRRIDAGFLARLVAEHRLDEDEAHRDGGRPRRPVARPRSSSCEPATVVANGRSRPRRGPSAARCTSGSATSSAPTRAGTPSTPRTPATGGSRPSPGGAAVPWSTISMAQEGLYTLVSRAADRDRFEVLSSLSRAHGASDARCVAALLRGARAVRRDDHRDRGRVSPRRRRRPRRRPARGPGRPRRRCARTPPRSCGPLPRAWSPGSRPGGGPTLGRSRSCRATTRRATERLPSGSSATWPSSSTPTWPRG